MENNLKMIDMKYEPEKNLFLLFFEFKDEKENIENLVIEIGKEDEMGIFLKDIDKNKFPKIYQKQEINKIVKEEIKNYFEEEGGVGTAEVLVHFIDLYILLNKDTDLNTRIYFENGDIKYYLEDKRLKKLLNELSYVDRYINNLCELINHINKYFFEETKKEIKYL